MEKVGERMADISTEELERFRNLEWEMQKYPQIQSLKEANLLLGTRRTFGIYQIKDDSPGENYAFMNMRFIESHGMQRMVRYHKGIEKGTIHPQAKPEVVFETPISAVIDGHNGMGQLISVYAMKKAIEKAKKTGVGIVTVRESNHFASALPTRSVHRRRPYGTRGRRRKNSAAACF